MAALSAAIVSSLASMLNSTATIFTMDLYKPYMNKNAGNKQLVTVGRLTVLSALLIATLLANRMGSVPQMFQYIQEYTGIVSPGILAVFLTGLFWKKTNVKAAIYGILVSIPIALALKLLPIEMPFIDQMLYTFLITLVVIIGITLTTADTDDDIKSIPLNKKLFETGRKFNITAYVVMILIVILYVVFW